MAAAAATGTSSHHQFSHGRQCAHQYRVELAIDNFLHVDILVWDVKYFYINQKIFLSVKCMDVCSKTFVYSINFVGDECFESVYFRWPISLLRWPMTLFTIMADGAANQLSLLSDHMNNAVDAASW